MLVRITRTRPTAVIPSYATPGAAAFDLTAAETVLIPPRRQGLVGTGLIFSIPKHHVLHIFARSSTFGKLGLILSNGVGVIDADYCGPEDEVKIMLYNPGDQAVTVETGMRIAQGIIYPRPEIFFQEGGPQGPTRGGIGSTGGY